MERKRSGYTLFVDHLKQHWQQTETFQKKQLEELIDTTEEYLTAAGDLTKDEAELIACYVKNDLGALAKEISQSRGSFREGVFYLALKETLWHWLEEVADHTRTEWSELALLQAERSDEVKAGDWSAAARLKCDKCGEEQLLKHPDVVTACGKCGEQAFHRKEFK